MSAKAPNRIASEDLSDVTPWLLPDVNGKVVPSAEKEAHDRHRHAEEVIEDVTADDVSYSPMTAEELQAITEAAEKEGFDKGHAEGLLKGQEEGQQQGHELGVQQAQQEASRVLDTQVGQLLQIAEALMEPIADQEQQLEQLLLDYVTRLTRQLIERELQIDSSHILSVVQRAIGALPVGAANLKVVLNPDDLALVEAHAEESQKDWAFRGDPALSPGGCRIETDNSLVDFSVESKIDALLQQFLDRQLVSEEADIEAVAPEIKDAIAPAAREGIAPAAREGIAPAAREGIAPAAKDGEPPA